MSALKKIDFDILPSPILLWDDEEERKTFILWQYGILSSIVLISLGIIAHIHSFGFSIFAYAIGGIGLFFTTVGFLICYFDDYEGLGVKKTIKENISLAAKKSINGKIVNLSDYLRLERMMDYSNNNEYLETLSSRHIKWAIKYYNKCIKELNYEESIGNQKKLDTIENIKQQLNAASNNDYIKEVSYHTKALKELRANQPKKLTKEEEFDAQLNFSS